MFHYGGHSNRLNLKNYPRPQHSECWMLLCANPLRRCRLSGGRSVGCRRCQGMRVSAITSRPTQHHRRQSQVHGTMKMAPQNKRTSPISTSYAVSPSITASGFSHLTSPCMGCRGNQSYKGRMPCAHEELSNRPSSMSRLSTATGRV